MGCAGAGGARPSLPRGGTPPREPNERRESR
nr:MAG TPA: hypothetical protein [Caudoviricetes sp.]